MVSVLGGIFIAMVVILAVMGVGWITFLLYRVRKLGLPASSISSYFPWSRRESPYGPPQPASGGITGWFNDQVRRFKNRNNRSAVGAYEPSNRDVGGGGGSRGAHRALDPDEAWDARVGNEADSYGYYEEELATRDFGSGRNNTEYRPAGGGPDDYDMNLAVGQRRHDDRSNNGESDLERGRQRSRSPVGGSRNPFDDDHAESLRGVSPRPMESGTKSGGSPSRHSIFRENV